MSKSPDFYSYAAKRFYDLPCEASEVGDKYPAYRFRIKRAILARLYDAKRKLIRKVLDREQ